MNKFFPNMYAKDIYSIDYKKLKLNGIKVLLFDFDNTLIEKGNYKINKEAVRLIKALKKDFLIYIVTNSIHIRKLRKVCEELDVIYVSGSRKPFKRGFKKIPLKNSSSEIAMIGDQLITDVWGGNRMNYYTILIDPINNNELLSTKINRVIEKIIFKKINVKRGEYYD